MLLQVMSWGTNCGFKFTAGLDFDTKEHEVRPAIQLECQVRPPPSDSLLPDPSSPTSHSTSSALRGWEASTPGATRAAKPSPTTVTSGRIWALSKQSTKWMGATTVASEGAVVKCHTHAPPPRRAAAPRKCRGEHACTDGGVTVSAHVRSCGSVSGRRTPHPGPPSLVASPRGRRCGRPKITDCYSAATRFFYAILEAARGGRPGAQKTKS